MFRQSKLIIANVQHFLEAANDEKDFHLVSKQKFIRMTFISAKLPLKIILPRL